MKKRTFNLKYIFFLLFFLATTSLLGENTKNFFSNRNNFRFFDPNNSGERLFYYDNGNIKSKQFYINNRKAGFWEFFYENGELRSTVMFNSSSQDEEASVKNYDKNGFLISAGKIINGEMTDVWNYYDENGKINHSYNYSTGEIIIFNEDEIPILKLEEQFFAEKLQKIYEQMKDERVRSLEGKEE